MKLKISPSIIILMRALPCAGYFPALLLLAALLAMVTPLWADTIVFTLPANGLTASSAVLNGSVATGSDSIAWFDWGTDTNYGNNAGETFVPGNGDTTNLTATLIGLDGNVIYHFRLVATNIYGAAYGTDQVFEVGLPPALSGGAITNLTTNSVIFTATVNPNGRNTSVYFVSPGHPTATIQIGSGLVTTNVQIPLTGLTAGTSYTYREGASNSAGTDLGAVITFQPLLPWNVSHVISQNWQAVASSADGNKLVAAPYGGNIYTSTNAGNTWALANVPNANGNWSGIASSADGAKLVATTGGLFTFQQPGQIYTSTNSGKFLLPTSAPRLNWDCVASSADGTHLVAVATATPNISNRGGVYTSADAGITWISNSVPAAHGDWLCVASSADGNKLVVAVHPGLVYSSTNAGSTWIANDLPATNWQSVASSADGNKLVAAVGGYYDGSGPNDGNPGPIFTSTNAGATWIQQTNAPISDWFCVASSADGNKLAAVVYDGSAGVTNAIFTSADAGVTWTANNMPVALLEWITSSADGTRLAAVSNGGGQIYTLQTLPSPVLSLSVTDNNSAISWIIPSLSFTLQQSSDLLNWTDLTNLSLLNLTNLQNQVILPIPGSDSFFRLVH